MTEQTSNPEESETHIKAGETLRKAREAAGLSRADITERLHLSGAIIDDIEQGRVERLSGIYRRGYISNYARLLGLDPEPLLGPSEPHDLPELREVLPVNRTGWKLEQYLKIATYVLATIAIVPPLVLFFIQGGSRILERQPEAAVAVEESTEASPSTREAGNRDAGRSASESEPGHYSASTVPLPKIRPLDEARLDVPDDRVVVIEPQAGAGAAPSGSELGLELREDSWVEIYAADGERLEYDLLRAGDRRNYEAEAPFRIMLGRGRAAQLTLNGEAVHFEGDDRGDVVRLELTAEGEVQR